LVGERKNALSFSGEVRRTGYMEFRKEYQVIWERGEVLSGDSGVIGRVGLEWT